MSNITILHLLTVGGALAAQVHDLLVRDLDYQRSRLDPGPPAPRIPGPPDLRADLSPHLSALWVP